MTRNESLAKLEDLFARRGGALYQGEAVSQLEHGLQAVWAAEAAGWDADMVAAALLHDVGHLLHGHGEDCADHGIDDRHEELGGRFLARLFGPAVTEPIRLHVPAKQYLCATHSDYLAGLSPASAQSLALQGGPMTEAESVAFARHPFADRAVALRRFDDTAKVPGLVSPPFAQFRHYLGAALASTE